MTAQLTTEELSVRALVDDQHAQIDRALGRVADAIGGPRQELLLAHDEVIGLLARHLLAVEVAVCPQMARRLPDGHRRVQDHLMDVRRLEMTLRQTAQMLWGYAHTPPVPLQVMHQRMVEQMTSHREAEERLLADLEELLTPAERTATARHLSHATAHAPTRPHPFAVRRLGWTRLLYRPVGVADRLLDAFNSRPVLPMGPSRTKRPGLWGSYALGRPLESVRRDRES